MQVFACGSLEKVGIAKIADFFEVSSKYAEEKACQDSTFSTKYLVNEESAIEYLKNDLEVISKIALAMNIVEEDLL